MFNKDHAIQYSISNTVKYLGKGPKINQSEARKLCFLASDWFKFETLPQRYHTIFQGQSK